MRITLAYPHDGHEPDDTIDVDDEVGRRLVHDGRARLAVLARKLHGHGQHGDRSAAGAKAAERHRQPDQAVVAFESRG